MIRSPMTVKEIVRVLNKNESKEVMALCKTNKKSVIDIKWLYKTDSVYGTAGGAEVRLNGKLLFMHLPNPCKPYEDWTDKEIFYEILERLGYEVNWEEEESVYHEGRQKENE